MHPWALQLFNNQRHERRDNEVALPEPFARSVAERIIQTIIDRGFGDSSFRLAHDQTYQDLRDYRENLVEQTVTVLQSIRISEAAALEEIRGGVNASIKPKPIGGYQRVTVADVEAEVEKIRAAYREGDDEAAHSLKDRLFETVVRKIAARGKSRIACAALKAVDIPFRKHYG